MSLPREHYANARFVTKLETIEKRLIRMEKALTEILARLEEKENKNKKSVDK
tara:strand:+ start:254 stop:409 length:156 start_codon:yes stop_codon:yes gene_type:complete